MNRRARPLRRLRWLVRHERDHWWAPSHMSDYLDDDLPAEDRQRSPAMAMPYSGRSLMLAWTPEAPQRFTAKICAHKTEILFA